MLVEADARLALELPNFRQYISMLMREPGIESAVYLTTENELTGTLGGRGCLTVEDREHLRDAAMEEMWESIHQLYTTVDEPMDLWQGDSVLRLIHGQGLTAPHELDSRWQRVLFPVRIADRVAAERIVAEQSGCQHRIDALTVGQTHTVVHGQIEGRESVSGLVLLDAESDRDFEMTLPFFPGLQCAPLRSDARDISAQRDQILALLNHSFLPYLHGLRQPPVLHLLAQYGGVYRVRVHYGSTLDDPAWDYELGYASSLFVEAEVGSEPAQEAYWANDLDDFLQGACDEFSPFCRQQFPVEEMRLWACLSTPLLHSEVVCKRVRKHFERASEGLCPGSWVMPLYEQDQG